MTVEEVREYLLGFNYILGDREKEAIERFKEYVVEDDRAAKVAGEDHMREAPNAG